MYEKLNALVKNLHRWKIEQDDLIHSTMDKIVVLVLIMYTEYGRMIKITPCNGRA